MRISSVILTLVLVFCFAPNASSQASKSENTNPAENKPADSKPADTKPDYTKEAFVDEDDSTKIVFENDGTGIRERSVRVRIQSDSRLQRSRLLTTAYHSVVSDPE